jgi:DNA-binding LytR/AlgR family response regulator
MKGEIRSLLAIITELGDSLNEDEEVYAALVTIKDHLEIKKGIKDVRDMLYENIILREQFIGMCAEGWAKDDAATVEKSNKYHNQDGEDIIELLIEGDNAKLVTHDQIKSFKTVLVVERDEVEAAIDRVVRIKKRKTTENKDAPKE